MFQENSEIIIKGLPICEGIAIGKPFFFAPTEEFVLEFDINSYEIENEVARYRKALKKCEQDIEHIRHQLFADQMFEGISILDTYLQIIQDPLITEHVESLIRQTCKNAESIFQSVINEYEQQFNQITDKFFRERFKDIQDISRRIMSHLRQSVRMSLLAIPQGSIIFANDIAPPDILTVKKGQVLAFVTAVGGETSHSAIVAKAKGIPYIANVDFSNVPSHKIKEVIVDGYTGSIVINPGEIQSSRYSKLQASLSSYKTVLANSNEFKAETLDGYPISLLANIESFEEIEEVIHHKGNGIGLFRSEYLLVDRDNLPTEHEQFAVYRQLIEQAKGLPVVIRVFDIGGDKFIEHNPYAIKESNPFLGCRAIRLLLKNRKVFKEQLRAILRASIYGPVHIMLPLVSGLVELRETKFLLHEVRKELKEVEIPYSNEIKVGCMIELPSSALISDILAKECDFFSIGTNDLVQYTIGVDRGNQDMSYLYSPCHPSVIRLIKMVVDQALKNNLPISICGEMAADPKFIPLLIGLGMPALSVAPRYLPMVKHAVRMIKHADSVDLVDQVLALSTAEEVQELLQQEYARQQHAALAPLLYR
ncbi:MAG: ptsI [Chlamydiales bacterium]|jgi:phosphotransferase system enzyme I (PtsI)|nr:ptsI [Chlamydiales bacterium]